MKGRQFSRRPSATALIFRIFVFKDGYRPDGNVLQTRRFLRQYKKLNDKIAQDVDDAVVEVAKNPPLEKKEGRLV
ncbi:type II toxin-antitoxin system RelE/ParE family toxin [Polynucleobacter necessarius]|uniref:type II toxin-antitoxin system RelE/ParE family toxin n=1 Tax=Polynucleobacter necessarius TaxID=576610 RepID=UPI0039E4810B